jgi:hypothetical protein
VLGVLTASALLFEGVVMACMSTAVALAGFALTGVSAAEELGAGRAYSVSLSGFNGALYYTVEPDGYRVVTTLASGAEATPIRFVSTLMPGQHMLISAPQAVGLPSLEFIVLRKGDALHVNAPASVTEVALPN